MTLSNLTPHSLTTFDPTRHLTGHDVFFTKKFVKLLIKWSKTFHTRDKVQCATLPKIPPFVHLQLSKHCSICTPCLLGSNPLTDSRVRKILKTLNVKLGLHPLFFTFHDFRKSGATFAYNCHVPIQDIKRHGTWSLIAFGSIFSLTIPLVIA